MSARKRGDACIYYRAGVEDFDYKTGFVLESNHRALLAEHDALLARVEAAEADAARYLWLRDEAAPDVWREIGAIPWPVKIDAAIDAARQGA